MPTKESVLDVLSTVKDPEIGRDIVSLGMVQNLVVEGGKVSFSYILTTPACPLKDKMDKEVRAALNAIPGVTAVDIDWGASVSKDRRLDSALPSGIRNVIAVGSGKGGVGKSTVAANLAVALAMEGARVGLMDADVYGPNQPQMFGIQRSQVGTTPAGKIVPPAAHGVKLMSMGFLVEPDTPVVWRGPMLHGVVNQFLKDVDWGELDYLVVDLPPGTGDVQLTLCQLVPLTGAVIVTTPQSIALSDVRKAVGMFNKLNVPILGVVENMADFECPHCHERTAIFAEGGAQTLADAFDMPVLGRVPIDPSVCVSGEVGNPIVKAAPNSSTAAALREIARQIAARISVANAQRAEPVSVRQE